MLSIDKIDPVQRQRGMLSVIGLKALTNKADLDKAYRQASRRTHPDLGGSPESFVEVREAYDYLLATLRSYRKVILHDNHPLRVKFRGE